PRAHRRVPSVDAGSLPKALGHPPYLHDQAPAAADAPDAAGSLRARPVHVPVLRQAEPRPDDRPRDTAAPRRPAHLGEPGFRVPGVQPPQGGADAPGGADDAAERAAAAARVGVLRVLPPPGAAGGLAEVHPRLGAD